MIRNIVMSDTGGWLPQLLNSFDELGIDAQASTIPKNMRVIHCGDIIHKGPYSSQLLAIITGLMVNNPGQWIQLLGNHEAQHLPNTPQFWPCACSSVDISLLHQLYKDGLLLPTWGLSDSAMFVLEDDKSVELPTINTLFSHGGLTHGFWAAAAGAENAAETAALLNQVELPILCTPGLMLGEDRPYAQVGPVWALANTEVFLSWRVAKETMPFTQFYGHTTSFVFDDKIWRPGLGRFAARSTLIKAKRAVATDLNNNLMLGVDPGFDEYAPRVEKQPWLEFYSRQ